MAMIAVPISVSRDLRARGRIEFDPYPDTRTLTPFGALKSRYGAIFSGAFLVKLQVADFRSFARNQHAIFGQRQIACGRLAVRAGTEPRPRDAIAIAERGAIYYAVEA
jgi:hypothetical protein